MAATGFQLTTFLYGLYAGRRRLPAVPLYLTDRDESTWRLGVGEGPVELADECRAVQVDGTTCGSASVALAKASDPTSVEAATLAGTVGTEARTVFNTLQHEIKDRTNRRKFVFGWPRRLGTPPWGAARELRFAGHEYFHRMVVDTSLPQSTRVLTHAAQCALRGFPVLLYVGGDTSMGIGAGVPRHVLVLHSPPQVELADESAETQPELAQADADTGGEASAGLDAEREMERKLEELEAKIQAKLDEAKRATEQEEVFDPEFLLYEPSTGTNSRVTLRQLIDRKVPKDQLGGWPHIMWAVMPKP